MNLCGFSEIDQFFKKHPSFGSYAHHCLGRNQETTGFRVPKLIFVMHLIQRILLNHYMRFNLNCLKVLEH